MKTPKITSKEQVTTRVSGHAAISLAQREIEAGKLAIFPVTGSIHELKRMLRKPARPVSIADMNLFRHT